jgi:ubiquinone/menaquinone biosynthesis C-methylase UbiE
VSDPARPEFEAFRAFERTGWDETAPRYQQTFGLCTSQAVPFLLDEAHVASGVRVLDLACGPGYAATAAVARGAIAAGLDLVGGMISRAKLPCPAADFREGDAGALPWPDASFNAVVSNFGVNHFPDVERALGEVMRVLAPGGRLAFTVWESNDRCEGQQLLHQAIAAHGRSDVELPPSPSAHRFADAAEAHRTLEAAGFTGVESRAIELALRAESARAAFEVFRTGTVRLSARLRHQPPESLWAIRDAFVQSIERYVTPDGVAVPMRAVLTSASR